MGGTEEEIKQKHQAEGKEAENVKAKVEEKVKDKTKKKGKESKEKDEDKEKSSGKEKKNPEDKKDPSKLKLKLEKIDSKMRDLAIKREEILKSIEEAEKHAVASPKKEDDPNLKQD